MDEATMRDVALRAKTRYERMIPVEDQTPPGPEYAAWLRSIGFSAEEVENWRPARNGGSGEGSGRSPEVGRTSESTTEWSSGSVQTAKPEPSPDPSANGGDDSVR